MLAAPYIGTFDIVRLSMVAFAKCRGFDFNIYANIYVKNICLPFSLGVYGL